MKRKSGTDRGGQEYTVGKGERTDQIGGAREAAARAVISGCEFADTIIRINGGFEGIYGINSANLT